MRNKRGWMLWVKVTQLWELERQYALYTLRKIVFAMV